MERPYDHAKVLSDYEHERITVEMAVGHALQHISKLYEAQAAIITDQRVGQAKLTALETSVNHHQTAIERLTVFMDRVLRSQKKPNAPNQPRSGQP